MIQDHRRNCDDHPVLSLEVTNAFDAESNTISTNVNSSNHQAEGSSNVEVDDPSNSSRMYHAALMNENSLDDLLQVFEAPESERAGVIRRVLLYGGPHTHFSDEQLQKLEMIKLQRNNASSANSGGAAHLTWEDAPHRVGRPSTASRHIPGEHSQKPESLKSPEVEPSRSQKSGLTSKSSPSLSMANGQSSSIPEGAPVDQNASSTAMNPCPTFARRHNQSRRKSSVGKPPFMVPSGATSTTSLSSPRRARLQRRNDPRRVQSKPELAKPIGEVVG
jgi:hypothetical protein